jgi:hypothetical protein
VSLRGLNLRGAAEGGDAGVRGREDALVAAAERGEEAGGTSEDAPAALAATAVAAGAVFTCRPKRLRAAADEPGAMDGDSNCGREEGGLMVLTDTDGRRESASKSCSWNTMRIGPPAPAGTTARGGADAEDDAPAAAAPRAFGE